MAEALVLNETIDSLARRPDRLLLARHAPRMWVTTGDCPPKIPCTASPPTTRNRFSGSRLKTGCKDRPNSACNSPTGSLPIVLSCCMLAMAPPSAVVWLFALPSILRWAELFKPQTTCG